MTAEAVQRLAVHYLRRHPGSAGRVLENVASEQTASALSTLAPADSAQVLNRLSADAAATAIELMDEPAATQVLLTADFTRAAAWVARLKEEKRSRLLGNLPSSARRNIEQALQFPPGTAGALMDPRATTLHEDTKIEDAFARVRQVKDRRITDVLLVDEEGRLTGVVALHDLVGAPDEAPIGSVARRDRPFVYPMATRDEVVDLLNRHNISSLPVVDVHGAVLGVLRYDALVRAAQQAATDDLQQMVGAGKEERALSSPFFTVKSRLPWLMINLLTAFAAAAVVGLFDATIAKFTALAVLMPVVAGQSGNAGAQALAVTSRGLALREIRIGHWWRVVRKEMIAAIANGTAVAIVTSIGVLVWSGSSGLALVIGISMVVSMLLAAMSGAAIPVILTALDRDPATASSIVLTTVTDVTGFFSFLGLATVLSELITAG